MKHGDLVFNTKTRTIIRYNSAMRQEHLLDLADVEDPVVQWLNGSWRNRWQDEVVVCIASGPSTTQAQLDYVAKQRQNGKCKVIAINRSYEQAPYADILFAKDAAWWDGYQEVVQGFTGEKWAGCASTARKYKLSYAEHEIGRSDHKLGLDRLKDENSGHQAINLAYLFGARTIILLGFEMNPSIQKIHFFGLHDERKGLENPNHDIFKGWIEKMNVLASSMPIPVYNCSINTAIKGFKQATLEEVLP